jgi:hypothetical protein
MIVVGGCDLELNFGSTLYVNGRGRVFIFLRCNFDDLYILSFCRGRPGQREKYGQRQQRRGENGQWKTLGSLIHGSSWWRESLSIDIHAAKCRPKFNAQKCSFTSVTARPEPGWTRGLQECPLFGDKTPSLLTSEMAATEFVYIVLLRRANQEHRNPETLTTVTERSAGLFHFERNRKI